MCRSIIVYTPSELPRSLFTFPFAKNRMADAAVVAMVDQLSEEVEATGISNLCEDVEQSKGGIKADCDYSLAAWRKGGSSRMDWLERREYVSNYPSSHSVLLTPRLIQKGQTYVSIHRGTPALMC